MKRSLIWSLLLGFCKVICSSALIKESNYNLISKRKNATRFYRSAKSLDNLRVRDDTWSSSKNAIGVSIKIAAYFGLLNDQVPKTSISLQFIPGKVDIVLRSGSLEPDKNLERRIGTNLTKLLVLRFREIIIIPHLRNQEVIIAKKIYQPDQLSEYWKLTIAYDLVSTNSGEENDILQHQMPIELHFECTLYRFKRQLFDALREDSKGNKFLTAICSSSAPRKTPAIYLENFFPEVLKLINVFGSKVCYPILKWYAYLSFSKFCFLDPTKIFLIQDVLVIMETITQWNNSKQLLQVISNDLFVKAWFSKAQMQAKIIRFVRHEHYYWDTSLARTCLTQFIDGYKPAWIRRDILAFIKRSVLDNTTVSLVRVMMKLLKDIAPHDYDSIWLANYLELICEFKIVKCYGFICWNSTNKITSYLSMLFYNFPNYFRRYSHIFYGVSLVKNEGVTWTQNNTLLNFALLAYCLSSQAIEDDKADIASILQKIDSLFSEYLKHQAEQGSHDIFEKMLVTLEYYLYLTRFVSCHIRATLVSTNHYEFGGLQRKPEIYIKLGTILSERLVTSFIYQCGRLKIPANLSAFVNYLAARHFIRIGYIVCNGFNANLSSSNLVAIAAHNLSCFSYVLYASYKSRKEREAVAGRLAKPLLAANIEGALDIIDILNTVGATVNPCGTNTKPLKLVWEAGGSLERIVLTEHSTAVLQSFLLFKFGISFDDTLSTAMFNDSDALDPCEFKSFVNFWIDRYCGILGKSPAYQIKIRKARPEILKREEPKEQASLKEGQASSIG